MGVVYEAVDTTLGRTVALKTFGAMAAIAPHEREAFEQRFLSEARISATLDDPHVVTVHDIGRDFESGLLFMALEYVRGETLANALARGPMPWKDAARIVAKVAIALNGAHAHQIVHRDIKPANIMLTPSGDPKIMDFGIAKASASQLTVAGQVFGTPAYMSPEQATGEEVDGRSDVFSLGAVLFELITNTRPFEGPTMTATLTKILREEPKPASTFGYGIPRAIDSIIARSLRKSRDARYDSAAHMADDLQCLIEGKPLMHATLSPLETVALSGIQPVKRPTPNAKPVVITHPDSQPGPGNIAVDQEPAPVVRSSPRLIAGVALGIAVGVGAVLLAQQRNKGEAQTPIAPAAGTPLVAATSLPAQASQLPPSTTSTTATATNPAPTVAPNLSVENSGPPARVSLDLRYPFASGSLRVKVDDKVVLATSLNGMPIKNGAEISGYDGRFSKELLIPPGEHTVVVELRSGTMEMSETSRVRLAPQSTHKLTAVVADNRLTLALN